MTNRSAMEGRLSLGDTDVEAASLDRRRKKLQAAKRAVATTRADVSKLDSHLDSNAAQHGEHQAALRTAMDRVATLQKTIKASRSTRDKLGVARKAAQRAATEAAHRADKAEAKYDRAVLADMLHRQKVSDLSMNADQSTVRNVTGPKPRQSGTTTRPRSET